MSEVDPIDAALDTRAQQSDDSGGDEIDSALDRRAQDTSSSDGHKHLAPHTWGLGESAKLAGQVASDPETWKGAARGALRAYSSATSGNAVADADVQNWSRRLGIQGNGTANASVGEGLGGFLAPLPGGKVGAEASAVDSPQSISAAASGPNLATASPELKAAAKEAGPNLNREVLDRHLEAESLPVPGQLSKGQATQDPVLISIERNQRGKNPEVAQKFQAQNQNLIDNLQAIRERAGPDVFSTNPVEHGEALMDAYKAKDAERVADVSQKYQALKDANGGKFPVDAQGLFSNVTKSLHDNSLFGHAPPVELRQLSEAAEKGNMTFEQFEAMRTNLARVMRSSSNGNEVAAAGVIRDEMEKLPLTGDAAQLKPLADSARQAARERFQAMEADPAYKAAVNDKVTPDRFVNRFIVNGSKGQVQAMRSNLAGDDTAQQTMGVAALDHLRNSARIDEQYRGNFAQQSYNKALQALSPKFEHLFDPKTTNDLATVGGVARNQQFMPAGNFVNHSNTTTSALAENAKGVAEHIVDAKTGGAWSLLAKPLLKGRAARKLVEEHFAPGAGLDYVPGGR